MIWKCLVYIVVLYVIPNEVVGTAVSSNEVYVGTTEYSSFDDIYEHQVSRTNNQEMSNIFSRNLMPKELMNNKLRRETHMIAEDSGAMKDSDGSMVVTESNTSMDTDFGKLLQQIESNNNRRTLPVDKRNYHSNENKTSRPKSASPDIHIRHKVNTDCLYDLENTKGKDLEINSEKVRRRKALASNGIDNIIKNVNDIVFKIDGIQDYDYPLGNSYENSFPKKEDEGTQTNLFQNVFNTKRFNKNTNVINHQDKKNNLKKINNYPSLKQLLTSVNIRYKKLLRGTDRNFNTINKIFKLLNNSNVDSNQNPIKKPNLSNNKGSTDNSSVRYMPLPILIMPVLQSSLLGLLKGLKNAQLVPTTEKSSSDYPAFTQPDEHGNSDQNNSTEKNNLEFVTIKNTTQNHIPWNNTNDVTSTTYDYVNTESNNDFNIDNVLTSKNNTDNLHNVEDTTFASTTMGTDETTFSQLSQTDLKNENTDILNTKTYVNARNIDIITTAVKTNKRSLVNSSNSSNIIAGEKSNISKNSTFQNEYISKSHDISVNDTSRDVATESTIIESTLLTDNEPLSKVSDTTNKVVIYTITNDMYEDGTKQKNIETTTLHTNKVNLKTMDARNINSTRRKRDLSLTSNGDRLHSPFRSRYGQVDIEPYESKLILDEQALRRAQTHGQIAREGQFGGENMMELQESIKMYGNPKTVKELLEIKNELTIDQLNLYNILENNRNNTLFHLKKNGDSRVAT